MAATSYSIIGKIDVSKPLLLTDKLINVPLNEAVTITDEDYIKFKKQLEAKNISEKEKDEEFQKLFKELWPNSYNRINNNSNTNSAVHLRTSSSIVTTNNHNCLKCSHICCDICGHCTHSCCNNCFDCNQSCVKAKPCIDFHILHKNNTTSSSALSKTTTLPKVDYTTYLSQINTVKINNDSYAGRYPNVASAYDSPFYTGKYSADLVKCSYNDKQLTEEVKLLESIKESNEKLRLQNKLEKTNDLIDDIIGKVGKLQNELKKKTNEIKIKEDILKLKGELNVLQSINSLSNSNSSKCNCNKEYDSTEHNSLLLRSISRRDRCRSKSPLSIHESKCIRARSASGHRLSKNATHNINPHHLHHHHYVPNKPKTKYSSNDYDYHLNCSNNCKTYKNISSRVDSWNCDWL